MDKPFTPHLVPRLFLPEWVFDSRATEGRLDIVRLGDQFGGLSRRNLLFACLGPNLADEVAEQCAGRCDVASIDRREGVLQLAHQARFNARGLEVKAPHDGDETRDLIGGVGGEGEIDCKDVEVLMKVVRAVSVVCVHYTASGDTVQDLL